MISLFSPLATPRISESPLTLILCPYACNSSFWRCSSAWVVTSSVCTNLFLLAILLSLRCWLIFACKNIWKNCLSVWTIALVFPTFCLNLNTWDPPLVSDLTVLILLKSLVLLLDLWSLVEESLDFNTLEWDLNEDWLSLLIPEIELVSESDKFSSIPENTPVSLLTTFFFALL